MTINIENEIEPNSPNTQSLAYLKIEHVCDALQLGRTSIYSLINEGALEARKFGRATRISRRSLENYVGGAERLGGE